MPRAVVQLSVEIAMAFRSHKLGVQVSEEVRAMTGGAPGADEPLMAAGLDSRGAMELRRALGAPENTPIYFQVALGCSPIRTVLFTDLGAPGKPPLCSAQKSDPGRWLGIDCIL